MKEKILIVDDEQSIVELLKFNLELNDFEVAYACDGIEGLRQVDVFKPDLILLDIMLPGIDGLSICQHLKEDAIKEHIPIIMLTAKSQDSDKFFGFEQGVDDYITKPFVVKELIYRIKAVLKRYKTGNIQENMSVTDTYSFGELSINFGNYVVKKNNTKIELTLKEFELLMFLIQNIGTVVSRDELLDKVWGYDFFGESRTLDVHIRNLRKKIGDENQRFIETVRGIGYRFANQE